MKKLLKLLLLPALCAFFLLQAQQVTAQSKDNDVLVMEFGCEVMTFAKPYGIYIFWPGKEVEEISLPFPSSPKEMIADKAIVFKKINELTDLGWELDIIHNNDMLTSYFFKRATPK